VSLNCFCEFGVFTENFSEKEEILLNLHVRISIEIFELILVEVQKIKNYGRLDFCGRDKSFLLKKFPGDIVDVLEAVTVEHYSTVPPGHYHQHIPTVQNLKTPETQLR
jgi:hypothetical protein